MLHDYPTVHLLFANASQAVGNGSTSNIARDVEHCAHHIEESIQSIEHWQALDWNTRSGKNSHNHKRWTRNTCLTDATQ